MRIRQLRYALGFALLGAVLMGALFGNTAHGEQLRIVGAVISLSVALLFRLIPGLAPVPAREPGKPRLD